MRGRIGGDRKEDNVSPRGLQSLSPNWKSATGYRTPNGGIPDLRRDEKMPKRTTSSATIDNQSADCLNRCTHAGEPNHRD
ncbi:hypothetical protein GEV33_000624 [Tenebrio molitor]|uniref:Uncharacterized protein n=1 Tax=Tenebrio molitor TaxID=7067 RepID=A0A8J6HX54_TENMO|nr:hypothetical protein GEV33_000624 [Tenebrio molitor]